MIPRQHAPYVSVMVMVRVDNSVALVGYKSPITHVLVAAMNLLLAFIGM